MPLSQISRRSADRARIPGPSTNSAIWRDAASSVSAIPSSYADRVREFTDVSSRDGRFVDAQGLTVENFGLTDNLMMVHALDLHGCALVTPRQAPADIWHDLGAFETCVRMAADGLASTRARASS